MHRRSVSLALVLLALQASCEPADDEAVRAPAIEGDEPHELCQLACETELRSGCVSSSEGCAVSCEAALSQGVCRDELLAHASCVASVSEVSCGASSFALPDACYVERVELEGCVEHVSEAPPPDCYGHACPSVCGRVGQQVCVPGTRRVCSCAAGGTGEQTCSADGCFWLPCSDCRA